MALEEKSYESDFYAWTNEQATLLRSGRLDQLDIEHLAEEIESMGKSERNELLHRLEILLMHLLKWRFQPNLQSRSWEATIDEQRERIVDHLDENPSLKSKLDEFLVKSYKYAIRGAMKETGLAKSTFPENCPWSIEQIMDTCFWPE
jgi:predicted  nucleic acid-binding Zn-ribbon protein